MQPILYIDLLPDYEIAPLVRNPFKNKILNGQFAACVKCFDNRHKDLIAVDRRDGRLYQHRGNAWAHHFWIGYNGTRNREHYQGSYDTAAYACWKAGSEIRKIVAGA